MNRTIGRSVAVVALAVAAWLPASASTAGTAPSASRPATTHTFVRDWVGHTRDLKIRADGVGKESIYAGCCDHAIDLTLRVSRPRGTARDGSVHVRVTRVHVYDRSLYPPRHPAPKVGDVGRMHLRNGVLHEPFTSTVYCNPAASRRGACGA